jgi:hypothetical protein
MPFCEGVSERAHPILPEFVCSLPIPQSVILQCLHIVHKAAAFPVAACSPKCMIKAGIEDLTRVGNSGYASRGQPPFREPGRKVYVPLIASSI